MPKMLTPAEITLDGARRVVTLQGMQVAVVKNKSEAVSLLCKTAIERRETLIVTVREGAGKKYLTITERGEVRPSAAPAPTTVRPNVADYVEVKDLGGGASAVEDTRAWVEETMLTSDGVEEKPKRRLFGFGRKH